MVSVTSAMPIALRSRVPAKIRSCICEPRRLLALCSPSTQVTPSRMFDLPHPFGPTTTAIPVPASGHFRAVAETLEAEDVDFL